MKKEQQVVGSLTMIHITAILVGTTLWMVKVCNGQTDGVALLGVITGVISVGCFCALIVLQRKRQEQDRQEQEQKQVQLELEHERQVQEVRRTAREEMESFRSAMTHSLRMPIAIIQGYTELLAGDMVKDSKVRKEYMEKIVQRSRYISEIMSRNVTEDKKLSNDKLSYSEVDLLNLVGHVVTDVHKVAREKGVTIQIVSAEDVLRIEVDEYLLTRVMFNLLENALKYMGRPGVVTIRVQKENEWANIRVQDDGLGLSTEETGHVFDNHFQGSNRVGGNGCGLYLVKQTVEAHGGEIYAQSSPGKGMRIVMKFPLKRFVK